MLPTLMILFSVIFLIFLEEFRDFFIKCFKIYWVKLWLPIIWFSWLVESRESLTSSFMIFIQSCAYKIILDIAQYFPLPEFVVPFTKILFLFLLGTIPLYLLYWRSNFITGFPLVRRPVPIKHILAIRAYAGIWIIVAVLLITK